jgi:ABC-2 type transport system permease protein
MEHVGAIVWAQTRILLNFMTRSGRRGWVAMAFTILFSLIWYGMFAGGALLLGRLAARPEEVEQFQIILPPLLLLGILYWQFIPLILVSTGSSLDLRRLLPYPIPRRELFGMEVVLRITTGLEVFLVVAGLGIGLLANPTARLWAVAGLLPYVLFNLFLSAGFRDLLTRLLSRRRLREVMVLLIVGASVTPQLVVTFMGEKALTKTNLLALIPSGRYWPWTLTSDIALGFGTWDRIAAMAGWTLLAYWFGRAQFEAGLKFDQDAAKSRPAEDPSKVTWGDRILALPGRLLPDPIGLYLEKDLKVYVRSSRFRIQFLMGFTFGVIVWLPVIFGPGRSANGFWSSHFLTWVSLYAVLLLSDVAFWNVLGFDRGAAQAYYVMPVRFQQVLMAKNILAFLAVVLEVLLVTLVYLLLRVRIQVWQVGEAITLTVLFSLFFAALGNLMSVYNARGVDPAQSWKNSSSGKATFLLLLVYPLALLPVLMALAGRWATGSEGGFYMVSLILLIIGSIFYFVSLDSAVSRAYERREEVVDSLSGRDGPISLGV